MSRCNCNDRTNQKGAGLLIRKTGDEALRQGIVQIKKCHWLLPNVNNLTAHYFVAGKGDPLWENLSRNILAFRNALLIDRGLGRRCNRGNGL
jgi:hypothetical protein